MLHDGSPTAANEIGLGLRCACSGSVHTGAQSLATLDMLCSPRHEQPPALRTVLQLQLATLRQVDARYFVQLSCMC